MAQQGAGSSIDRITGFLGKEAEDLLGYTVQGIPKERLMLPSADHVSQPIQPRTIRETNSSDLRMASLSRGRIHYYAQSC